MVLTLNSRTLLRAWEHRLWAQTLPCTHRHAGRSEGGVVHTGDGSIGFLLCGPVRCGALPFPILYGTARACEGAETMHIPWDSGQSLCRDVRGEGRGEAPHALTYHTNAQGLASQNLALHLQAQNHPDSQNNCTEYIVWRGNDCL